MHVYIYIYTHVFVIRREGGLKQITKTESNSKRKTRA